MKEEAYLLVAGWAAFWSLVAFAAFGLDKRRAKKKRRRVPEKTLFVLCAVGGGLGGLVGMRFFRHKTQHASFVWGVPALLLLNAATAAGAAYLIGRFVT